jgi:hypothetical protein
MVSGGGKMVSGTFSVEVREVFEPEIFRQAHSRAVFPDTRNRGAVRLHLAADLGDGLAGKNNDE